MVEKTVAYELDGRRFEGVLVYDDSVKTKRPAIFSQPDWKGVCAETIDQARTIAGKDYVVMLADMYGVGYSDKPKGYAELLASVTAIRKDLAFTRACGAKAYETLFAEANKLGLVDPARKAAIGYCAGGGFLLEQARTGADFKAVVVYHVTNPNPVDPATPCNIKGRVLALHGADDTVTPKPMMDVFEKELTDAKVDWQVTMFGGAVHSFCDPGSNNASARYDEKLCRKSYAMTRDFFAETW